MKESKWLTFGELPNPGKRTKVFQVTNKDQGVPLGVVKWFGPWRGYAFFPAPGTLFEKTCLRDIAAFVEEENRIHRAKSSEVL